MKFFFLNMIWNRTSCGKGTTFSVLSLPVATSSSLSIWDSMQDDGKLRSLNGIPGDGRTINGTYDQADGEIVLDGEYDLLQLKVYYERHVLPVRSIRRYRARNSRSTATRRECPFTPIQMNGKRGGIWDDFWDGWHLG